jgi:multidrug efflux pump subunit AcrA (membrane-fusion protein)
VELKVHVGQDVKAGEELAVLGSQEIRQAEYRLAVEQEEKAKAQLASELALSEQRIRAAELAEQQAKA